MTPTSAPAEVVVDRRAFEAWSVEIPATFEETLIADDGYWHAYDEHRSVSLTSFVISNQGVDVAADEIFRHMAPVAEGAPIEDVPRGLMGVAAIDKAPRGARASRILSGLIAARGRALLVTITSDDMEWARQTWLSIRYHYSVVEQRLPSRLARRAHHRRSRSGRARR